MEAGLLKETITVYQSVNEKDDYGANQQTWQPYIITRANVTYNNGNRTNENNEIVFIYEEVFTTRIYHNIDENMRIGWKNKQYRILSIEPDSTKQRMIIRTALIND